MSLQFTHVRSLPVEAGCETRKGIVLLWPLLRNNNMVTNIALQVTVVSVLPHVTMECRRLGR